MNKIYTKVKTIEDFNRLDQLDLKDEYQFFYSAFFQTKLHEIKELLKKKELALFTFTDKDKFIIGCGNSKNCKYQKYTFVKFDDFIKLITKSNTKTN